MILVNLSNGTKTISIGGGSNYLTVAPKSKSVNFLASIQDLRYIVTIANPEELKIQVVDKVNEMDLLAAVKCPPELIFNEEEDGEKLNK
jgi:hypothetical protein